MEGDIYFLPIDVFFVRDLKGTYLLRYPQEIKVYMPPCQHKRQEKCLYMNGIWRNVCLSCGHYEIAWEDYPRFLKPEGF